MTPEQMENGRIGVELMTAWTGSGRTNEFFGNRVRLLVEENTPEDSPDPSAGFAKACACVAQVASNLLIRLAQVTGLSEEQVLQKIAEDFQPRD